MKPVQPDNWPRPSGYSNGIKAEGEVLYVAGQVGWDASETIVGDDLVDQIRQALENIVSIVRAAGAEPSSLVRMSWYVTDVDEYRRRKRDIGAVYRDVIGAHYPAMTLLGVAELLEEGAKVEIEATAVLP